TLVSETTAEGYHTLTVTHTAASADSKYQGLTSDIAFRVIDDDGPNALPDEVETDEDAPLTFSPVSNDVDLQGYSLSVTSVTQGTNGSVALHLDGTVTYTPHADWNGEDSFDYTISDGHGGTDIATVTVDVVAVNDNPVIATVNPQTNAEGDQVSLQINATDVDS